MAATATVRASGRRIAISHPEKVLFGAAGVTKRELAEYYAAVADVLVPHLRDRPLAWQSFPAGVERHGYFAKRVPKHFPGWVPTARVPKREGGTNVQVRANTAAVLAYLAGQNAVALHVWTARADALERPDRLVIDLDPDAQSFAEVRAAARATGALLRDVGLEPFAMVTGSRGIHVVAPLQRRADTVTVRSFGAAVTQRLAAEHPAQLTTAFAKAERGGRLYLDLARNGYGQHAIAAYSPRALPNAPVATPLRWAELDDATLDPQGWTLRTVRARLADLGGDPWAGLSNASRGLRGPIARLQA